MKSLFRLVILCLVLRISYGDSKTRPPKHGGVDVTSHLWHATIYIQSLDPYQSGWYMASTNMDMGHFSTPKHPIRDMEGKRMSLKKIFSPYQPFRFEVLPCGGGTKPSDYYVCIRNQYLDNHGQKGVGNSTRFDPHSFYLGVANAGDKHGHILAKLYFDTAEAKAKPDILQWKIKCERDVFSKHVKKHTQRLEYSGNCNLINKYFEKKDKILVLNNEKEPSYFEMVNRFRVGQQFNLKILRPRFRQHKGLAQAIKEGKGITLASTCNLSQSPVDQLFALKTGISATKARIAKYSENSTFNKTNKLLVWHLNHFCLVINLKENSINPLP